MEKEKKQKLNYEGKGIIQVKCECNANVNMALREGEISICGHCNKETKLEIYQIELAKGSYKEKYIDEKKNRPIEKMKEVDMRKVKSEADKIKQEIKAQYK